MSIDANSAIPMYRQLADLLRAQIADGELGDGDRLPSEAQLGETHGISRITVRQALAELERAGMLLRVPGKGAFVRAHSPIQGLTRLSGFSESARAAGREAGYR
ncbi:MAG: GntR family transcriptional regulator, partial [Thermomicrobiales bacterium]|nr:GntR family transcriptional regulator [Thermomicrobiales bacterium]